MATLSDSDYAKWIEGTEEDIQEDIILSDEDIIKGLEKELKKVKKQLRKKQSESARLNIRNEELVMIIRGKKKK